MATSFRNRLLLLFLGLLGITLVVTIGAVLRATNENVETLVRRELQVAQRVFFAQLDENSRQLRERGELLADDFGFKRAIATGETETISSVLGNHGDRIDADLVAFLSPQREVRIATHDMNSAMAHLSEHLKSDDGLDRLAVIEHHPYQLVFVPVRAPDLIGWIGLGFAIDRKLLQRLKGLTKTDITLFFSESPDRTAGSLSTLPQNLQPDDAGTGVGDRRRELASRLNQRRWLSNRFTLMDRGEQQLTGLLSTSLSAALTNYRPLRLQMMGIAAAALLLAAAFVYLIARGVTRPIDALVRAASRIAGGDYRESVRVRATDEFGVLADTFNLMQGAIAEREGQIDHQVRHDLLTGLPNRYHIGEIFRQEVAEGTPGSRVLMLVELTNLGQLSDLYGSDVADDLLVQAAGRLHAFCGNGDLLARVGDRQFLLIAVRDRDRHPEALARHLRNTLGAPFTTGSMTLSLETALGLVLFPEQRGTFEDLSRRAQIALNQAVGLRDRYCLYLEGQEERHLRQIKITDHLLRAIEGNGFELNFQPRMDLRNGSAHQVEALLRWTDPEMGPMNPEEFIPLAERSGNITRITRWVVEQCLQELRRWQDLGYPLSISLNLSARDIIDDQLVGTLIRQWSDTGLAPGSLAVEVTESILLVDLEAALRHLDDLRRAGIHLSLDDFGTGYSSLSQLKSLPVQELKIDKSFVLNLDTDPDNRKIVAATIDMAHQLGLEVVAEGVETLESLLWLRRAGCDSIQGFYLSRPMARSRLADWLDTPPEKVERIRQALFTQEKEHGWE